MLVASLLLSSLANAAPPPPEGQAPQRPPEAMDPTRAAKAEVVQDILLFAAEPVGAGDDRTAGKVEAALQAQEDTLRACREQAVARGADPLRFVSAQVKFGLDGLPKKVKRAISSGDEAVDTCVLDVFRGLELDPPPMFPDKLQVNVTWQVPEADEDAAP